MHEFEIDNKNKLTTEEATTRLKDIQFGLRQVLASLHEKIELFSSEPQFQDGLENLKRDVETRATDLETEVKRLRYDLKTIKDFLGDNLEKKNPFDLK